MRILVLFASAELLCSFAAAALVGPTTAEQCGTCHRAIHEAWKRSSHANAMESRTFQDALALAAAEFGPGARRTCLGCHAPLAIHAGDLAMDRKTSWEGVTCDYCHSVRDVSLKGANPQAVLNVGPVKTGPLADANSMGHQTAYSAVHLSSKVCMPCHEYRNAAGFPVLTTVSEWQASRYAKEGKECQSCHMGRVAGNVVDPRLKRSLEGKVNLHEMPGSHSLIQLNRSVKASLSSLREGDQLQVIVRLTNASAGHSLPTGSPMRELVLDVRADGGSGGQHRAERVYARRVADKKGSVISREHVAFMQAARQLSDTRLVAGETRQEVFTFPIARGNRTKVQATLWYYYVPVSRAEPQNRIAFLTLTHSAQ